MTCFTWVPSTTRYSPIWKSWYSSMLVKTEICHIFVIFYVGKQQNHFLDHFNFVQILNSTEMWSCCTNNLLNSTANNLLGWGIFCHSLCQKYYYEALRIFSFENCMLRSEITCIKKPFCRTKRFRKCEKSSFFLRVGEVQLPFFSHKNERVSHQNNYKKHKQKITFARCQIIISFKVC